MSAKKKAPGPSRALLDWLEANKVQYGPRRSSRLGEGAEGQLLALADRRVMEPAWMRS